MCHLGCVIDPLLLVLGNARSPLELNLRHGSFDLGLGIYKITYHQSLYWKIVSLFQTYKKLVNMHT